MVLRKKRTREEKEREKEKENTTTKASRAVDEKRYREWVEGGGMKKSLLGRGSIPSRMEFIRSPFVR